ncbi:MAG: hypothetical protein M1839_008239 [Geoglossum umbratile]|nr:MAG: hypothetical protein M1839_008239 [Geoglossum umbratile]
MAPKQITLNWLEQNLWSKIPAVIFSQVPILLDVRDYLRKMEVEKLKSLPANSLTEGETAPTVLAPDRPTTSIRGKKLSLRFETELKCPVTYKNEHRLLSGFVDYSLWYSDENGTSTNLLIVETKKLGTSETAIGQLLAYMAVVHRTRKAEGKQNAVIYGMTTDNNLFRFFRLDNDSKVSRSKILEWKLGEDELICAYIRYIIRAAMASSPSTSPLKPEKAEEITLASFGTEGGAFDYNVTPYEGEDDGSELLELPDTFDYNVTPYEGEDDSSEFLELPIIDLSSAMP